MVDRTWLDEVRKRWVKATRGEWRVATCGCCVSSDSLALIAQITARDADVPAIAAAPADVARLLRVAEAAQRFLDVPPPTHGTTDAEHAEYLAAERALQAALRGESGGGE